MTGGTRKDHASIHIDKEGTWYYQGLPIIHPEIYRYLNQHLERDEKGNYRVRIGDDMCCVDVEDAPFVVTYLRLDRSPPGPRFMITLNDGTRETLQIETMSFGDRNVPYCLVKGRWFKARLSRASYYELAKHIEYSEDTDEFFIMVNGTKYPLVPHP